MSATQRFSVHNQCEQGVQHFCRVCVCVCVFVCRVCLCLSVSVSA